MTFGTTDDVRRRMGSGINKRNYKKTASNAGITDKGKEESKITGYIQSIYKVKWDTRLVRDAYGMGREKEENNINAKIR